MYMRNGNHWLHYKQGVQGDRKDTLQLLQSDSSQHLHADGLVYFLGLHPTGNGIPGPSRIGALSATSLLGPFLGPLRHRFFFYCNEDDNNTD